MSYRRRALSLLLVALFPFLIALLGVRLAFTENFVEFLYGRVELPPDSMPYELRLSIAKMGLRSVTSNRGMEEFKNSGLFNQKEIRHMEDVKGLLDSLFTLLYVGAPLWLMGLLNLKNKKEIGKALFFGSLLLELFVLLVVFVSLISYQWLFEAFHNLFFDPYSWRFRNEDMLLRVYPMDFWYKATLYTALGIFTFNLLLQSFGLLLWRKNS
ncbi:MAG: TIGR01906 family membrane protein [Aquificaceae bacterium]|nr:TIGR01906 family membrane protein [Aquificaceae bacterium]